jgi:hypothetical protein
MVKEIKMRNDKEIKDLFNTMKEQQNYVHLEELGKDSEEQLITLNKKVKDFNKRLFEKLENGKITENEMRESLEELNFFKSAYARLNNQIRKEKDAMIFKKQKVFNPLLNLVIISHILLTSYLDAYKSSIESKMQLYKEVFSDIAKNYNNYIHLNENLYFLSEKNMKKVVKEMLKTKNIKALDEKYSKLTENLKNIVKSQQNENANKNANNLDLAIKAISEFDKNHGLNKENVGFVKDFVKEKFNVDLSIERFKDIKLLNELNFDFSKIEFKNLEHFKQATLDIYRGFEPRDYEKSTALEMER